MTPKHATSPEMRHRLQKLGIAALCATCTLMAEQYHVLRAQNSVGFRNLLAAWS
ncbi:MAG: hypothetical protein HOJ57_09790 [Lentisphaerae bacterium]|nr:hypothetical protein [Lentisphaerota bacterium]MBT7057419.1 hypothetical protein [Lentisphaerota bacterium]